MSLADFPDSGKPEWKFKKNPSRFLEEVASGTPITITQGRKANAILIPRDTWARLLIRLEELEDELETRELLADPKIQERLREGLPARGIPLAKARARSSSPFIWSESQWKNQKLRDVPNVVNGGWQFLRAYIR